MSIRKCWKHHNIQHIRMSGTDGKFIDHIRHDFYCETCKKIRSLHELDFKLIRRLKNFVYRKSYY